MNVYITGTDRGLGLALAAKFLEHNDTIFAGFYGIDPSGLNALQGQYGKHLEIIPLDVGSDLSVATAAKLIASKTDRLDVLINNAAIIGQKDATVSDALDFDDMLKVYNVNALGALRGPNRCWRCCAPANSSASSTSHRKRAASPPACGAGNERATPTAPLRRL